MAKRFTDTQKWSRPSYRNLLPEHKLLLNYVFDMCDHAGIWEEDLVLAKFQIGLDKEYDSSIYEALSEYIIYLIHKGNNVWFIPSFVELQYGTLNHTNRVHQSTIEKLSKYGIDIDSDNEMEWYVINLDKVKIFRSKHTPSIPLPNSIQTPIYKDKDIDKDKAKEKAKINNGAEKNSIYKEMMQMYHDFILDRTSVAPQITKVDGMSMKSIISQLEKVQAVIEGRSNPLMIFRYILEHWSKLDNFYQKQLKLVQISSNLVNIIAQLNPKNNVSNTKQTDINNLANQIRTGGMS